jgi:hypothetical protein
LVGSRLGLEKELVHGDHCGQAEELTCDGHGNGAGVGKEEFWPKTGTGPR